MITHTIFHQLIQDNIRVELVYENYPVIAGADELSLILRFRYIGPVNSNSTPTKSHKEREHTRDEEDKINSGGDGWFGGRLSSQLSNATRALFLQQLETLNEEEDYLKDISVYLGYTQIFGYYSINDQILDSSIFEELQKSTTIEGKLAGINGLEITFGQNKKGLLNGLTTLFQQEFGGHESEASSKDTHIIPVYSTTQSILFSDITFKPSQLSNVSTSSELTRSFYINLKLPKDIPPSYKSESVQINYNLIFGYQLMEADGKFTNKTMFFPLKIQPYLDKFGRQPCYHLEKPRLNQRPDALKSVDMNTHGVPDTLGLGQNGRKLSLKSFKTIEAPVDSYMRPRRTSSNASLAGQIGRKGSVASIESLRRRVNMTEVEPPGEFDLDNDVETQKFLSIIKELSNNDVNEVIKIQEKFESEFHGGELSETNTRQNLMSILADYQSVQKHTFLPEDDVAEMEGIIPTQQQTKYIIKQSHLRIASLNLNKSIFKVGDRIMLNISFLGHALETKGVDVQIVKDQVVYRDEYLKRHEYNELHKSVRNGNHLETSVYQKLVSTFNCQEQNVSLLIPYGTEPQFKTNFFQVKYYVQVRFILVDSYGSLPKQRERDSNEGRSKEGEEDEQGEVEDLKRTKFDLDSIFTDYKGSILFKGVDHFANGFEFTVRLPITVLPTYEGDFGSVTSGASHE